MIIDDDDDNDEIIDILYTCIPIKRLLVQANNITIDFAFTYVDIVVVLLLLLKIWLEESYISLKGNLKKRPPSNKCSSF